MLTTGASVPEHNVPSLRGDEKSGKGSGNPRMLLSAGPHSSHVSSRRDSMVGLADPTTLLSSSLPSSSSTRSGRLTLDPTSEGGEARYLTRQYVRSQCGCAIADCCCVVACGCCRLPLLLRGCVLLLRVVSRCCHVQAGGSRKYRHEKYVIVSVFAGSSREKRCAHKPCLKHGVRSLGAHKTQCCSWFVGGLSII